MQNRLFRTNQKGLFDLIEGKERDSDTIPDPEESNSFWPDIWGKEVKHNTNGQWA